MENLMFTYIVTVQLVALSIVFAFVTANKIKEAF